MALYTICFNSVSDRLIKHTPCALFSSSQVPVFIFGLDDGPAKSVVVSFSSILYHLVDTHLCHSLEGSKVHFFGHQQAFYMFAA
jgi:hypothetical protein